jgi:hypothetical protein
MMRWARAVSFQRLGSSACVFSSASRAFALSKSKVPPQQPDRLLDVGNDVLCFGAHSMRPVQAGPTIFRPGDRLDVTIARDGSNLCAGAQAR